VAWPGPAHRKDALENRLNEMVCDHAITLAAAQQAIARNWIKAYARYLGPPA
jgi:hypothetical protein